MAKTFDYIIAGGGSAGCTLAARLSEDANVRVLLLEAGGSARNPFVAMPAGNGFLFGNPNYDWGYTSEPQIGMNGGQVYLPRGKGLGGSSNLNGMVYMRGNKADYDAWQQTGLTGWGYADLLPYFKRAEGSRHRRNGYHGNDGPLTVCHSTNFNTVDEIFVSAAQRTGAPLNDDFNGASQVGIGQIDVTIDRGRRQSAARAYLRNRRSNLTIRTNTRVVGLDIQSRHVRGVLIQEPSGIVSIKAEKEVVVCMGAYATPHLLLISGIGPADDLRAMGINPQCDLPGVGQNLRDHLNMPVQFRCLRPDMSFARNQRLDRAICLALQYALFRKGPGAAPFWGTCLFSSLDDGDRPHLQTYFMPMVVKENLTCNDDADEPVGLLENLGRRILVRGKKKALCGFQFDINLMHPESVGRVFLKDANPFTPVGIDLNYLDSQRDIDHLIEGIKIVRRIVDQPDFEGVCGAELSPGAGLKSSESLSDAVRTYATTGHHPVGTCKMGSDHDSNAVLDRALRVRGAAGLRVCDASVFPTQITGNPNAPIIAIAEKASDIILGRTPLPPETPKSHEDAIQ